MKKIFRTVFNVFCSSLFCTFSFAQQKTGANSETARAASNDTLSVWAAPAEQKVRPDDKIESTNIIWSKSGNKIKVAGAGNEHVPFQVVITSPVPPRTTTQTGRRFFHYRFRSEI